MLPELPATLHVLFWEVDDLVAFMILADAVVRSCPDASRLSSASRMGWLYICLISMVCENAGRWWIREHRSACRHAPILK